MRASSTKYSMHSGRPPATAGLIRSLPVRGRYVSSFFGLRGDDPFARGWPADSGQPWPKLHPPWPLCPARHGTKDRSRDVPGRSGG